MAKKKAKKTTKNKITKNQIIAIAAAVIIIAVLFSYSRLSNDKIAATVNGEPILKEDVLREYLKVSPEMRSIITTDQILEGMIMEAVLLQEAEKQGIEVSDEEVEELIDQVLAENSMTEEELRNVIEEQGSTLEELKSTFKRRMAINSLLEKEITSKIEVFDDEVRQYYDENSDQFTTPEQVRASHILVNTSPEAKSIRNRALEGEDFAGIAKKYSICPSAPNGGDLGWFSRGQMVKEFEDAAFSLKLNQISPVVETQFGFHIIKLTGKKPESKKTFDESKEEIMQALFEWKKQDALEVYAQQLRAASDIEIFMVQKKEPEGTPVAELNNLRKNNSE